MLTHLHLHPLLALLDEDVNVTPTLKIMTLADLWFYGMLFVVLVLSIFAVAVMAGKNASHSIGSMRSAASGVPHTPSGGRFNGPAVHGHW